MKFSPILLVLVIFISCNPNKNSNKFKSGDRFSYVFETKSESEFLAEVIPQKVMGFEFEVVDNTGEVAVLEVSSIGNGTTCTLEVNNEGYLLNEAAIENFTTENSLSLHQLHYLFVPIPSETPEKNTEWTHQQKLPSAMSISDIDFEDTFVYQITDDEGDNFKIKMRAKVGAMSALQDGDNVSGEYLVEKKSGLLVNGKIDIQFMTGVVHLFIERIDD